MHKTIVSLLLLLIVLGGTLQAQKKNNPKKPETPVEEKSLLTPEVFDGLKFRSIGPALTSGRISDFAVNPDNIDEYYVASASGGVWKTINHGVTFEPVFDAQGAYSIGCVTVDPNNPHVVWVGTGENNAQRALGYGDGVYKSTDGGKNWENMGLKLSEHIGRILVDPRNSNVVFVAAQGPVWSSGGDRGLYKSSDGGKTWRSVITVDEHTGVNEVICDPRDPDVMYASTWQRARRVWTFVGGGPGSGLWKSTDGGETWFKSQSGLPSGDLGRIGLAISPANPDVIYAAVEAQDDSKSGFYRSTNRGATWEKRNSYVSKTGNYYVEIFADPVDVDKVFFMDTYAHVTHDGGKTIERLPERYKHVDNHAMWINPKNPNHYLMGCDGGVYETWNDAQHWHYKANLPVTQFYKVTTDNAEPFYNVFGGTQDNFSLGGPSRVTDAEGIENSDWYVTNTGDGFESQVDPKDPNTVYAQAQYGSLSRFNRLTGESIYIQPQEGKGEEAYRWNWDAPLIISPHEHTRLYFAANKVFRSDDQGNSWKEISPDLSRGIDRNQLEVMGRIWSMDAVNYHQSTSIYGNITALDESPRVEGLLYAGTDDGGVNVREDGDNWRAVTTFPGVPEATYVNMLLASQHDNNTVFAVFNNHKSGDFKPYLLKSTDRGRSWSSLAATLPERGSVYSIAEDHVDPNLLFAGTEFGFFFSYNGGQNWIQLKKGLPTIAVRDIAIQRRENDLVLATFGRGFYILDDYSALRNLSEEKLAAEAILFPTKDAWIYVEESPLGYKDRGFQGESFFISENPPHGAVFTYYLKEKPKTLKELRQEREKALLDSAKAVPYPSLEEIRAEEEEEKPFLLFTVTDANGKVVNRLKETPVSGISRLVWDFRLPPTSPVSFYKEPDLWSPYSNPPTGRMVNPGTYYVTIEKSVNGVLSELAPKQAFKVKALDKNVFPAQSQPVRDAFLAEAFELDRAVDGARSAAREMKENLRYMEEAVRITPSAPVDLLNEIRALGDRIRLANRKISGDETLSRLQSPVPPSISGRIGFATYGLSGSSSGPTESMRQQFEIAKEEFAPVYEELKAISSEIKKLEEKLEAYKAPYTPGRMPLWQGE